MMADQGRARISARQALKKLFSIEDDVAMGTPQPNDFSSLSESARECRPWFQGTEDQRSDAMENPVGNSL